MLTLRGLDRVLGDLSEMGYDARWGVVGAYHVGAPHRRERIWIIAKRGKFLSYSQHNGTGWGKQQQKSVKEKTGETLHSNSKGLERHERERIQRKTWGEEKPCRFSWWSSEPGIHRVANGVANKVDRIKAIGNGQVPLVAATAWRILGGE